MNTNKGNSSPVPTPQYRIARIPKAVTSFQFLVDGNLRNDLFLGKCFNTNNPAMESQGIGFRNTNAVVIDGTVFTPAATKASSCCSTTDDGTYSPSEPGKSSSTATFAMALAPSTCGNWRSLEQACETALVRTPISHQRRRSPCWCGRGGH